MVERSEQAYIEKSVVLNLTAIIETGVITTVISLNNESIFSYLERDLANPHYLLSCLDNAIVSIDLVTKTAFAISGLPTEPAYVEGIGSEARYSGPLSLVQVDRSTIIIADTQNFCLRQIDRDTMNTSTFAGECENYGTAQNDATVTRENLRLMSPQALIYDKTNQSLYLADGETIYSMSVSGTEVYKIVLNDRYAFNSLILSTEPNQFLIGTTTDEVVSVTQNNEIKVIAGKGLKHNADGQVPGVKFDTAESIVQVNQNSYLLVENSGHKLRGLDLAL